MFVLSVILVVLAMVIGGCGKNQGIAVGSRVPADQWAVAYQDSCVEWFQSLNADQVKTLQISQGPAQLKKLAFPYAELKAKDPRHAAIVDGFIDRANREIAPESVKENAAQGIHGGSAWSEPQDVELLIRSNGMRLMAIHCRKGPRGPNSLLALPVANPPGK
jgi:hypothetical protein